MTEISIIKNGETINQYSSASPHALAEMIGMVEKRPQSMESNILRVAFQDYVYPKFGIQIEQFHSQENSKFTASCEVEPIMGFCLLTKGSFSAKTSLYKNPEFEWQVGSANLLFRNGMGSMEMNIPKGEMVEMVNFVIPQSFIEELISREPETFEQLATYTSRIENGTIFKENHLVTQNVMKSANDIYKCRMLGNNAPTYLESKIMECISGLLLPMEEGYWGTREGCLGKKENLSHHPQFIIRSKMHDAKDIILMHYQNMPSLHELAQMVGTNECTLKKAFKQEFGSTVFQYLFDYRMVLASQYLLDSDLPIADIGIKLGYDYPSHFCTAFKRKYGVSPMEYRLRRGIAKLRATAS